MDESTLEDFDYTVSVTIASSQLSQMRRNVMVLDLSLRYSDGSIKHKSVELSEDELDSVSFFDPFDSIHHPQFKMYL
jgi:hypothetical protein